MDTPGTVFTGANLSWKLKPGKDLTKDANTNFIVLKEALTGEYHASFTPVFYVRSQWQVF